MRTRLLLCLAACSWLSGCSEFLAPSTPAGECTNAPTLSNSVGLLHGIACENNGQCKYGRCTKTALVLTSNSPVAVCTKDCSCGVNSSCSQDDDPVKGLEFKCVRIGVTSQCALRCSNDEICKKANPALPNCVATSGVKVCTNKTTF